MKPSATLSIDRYIYAEKAIALLRSSELDPSILFDIGAGDARFSALSSPCLEWIGFDREAWGAVLRWDLINACPLINKKADVVLLLDVIEHLPNPGLALQRIANAMKPEGILVITTPNPKWSASRLNLFFKGVLSGFSPHDLQENYHVLPIWPHVLNRFLSESGFQVESYSTLDGKTRLFSAPGSLFFPARWCLNAIQILIEAFDASARGMSYGFIAKRTSTPPVTPSYPSSSQQTFS